MSVRAVAVHLASNIRHLTTKLMSVATIANRYARALADVIIEKREVNEVSAELNQFAKLVEGHQQLREVFASPVLATESARPPRITWSTVRSSCAGSSDLAR